MNQRSIIIFALLSVAVFTGLAVYGDARELFKSILLVSPRIWIGAILMTLLHIVVRIARWHYYLRVVVTMYMAEGDTDELPLPVPPLMAAVMIIAVVGVIYLGIAPGRVLELVQGLAGSLI